MTNFNFLTPTYIRQWRALRKLSRRELGNALGYRGREYVKKIELGQLPVTDGFARRFVEYKNKCQARERRAVVTDSRYALPPQIKILAHPRRCVICREWFIFPNASDRVCTDRACRREWATRLKNKTARRVKPGARRNTK